MGKALADAFPVCRDTFAEADAAPVSGLGGWLLLDASAPVIGVASTYFFTLPDTAFGTVLALFAGFFLYIGASDLIPESYHAHPKFLTTVMTLAGAAVLYLAIALIGQ